MVPVAGEELVITARTGRGAAEIARHRLSVPGSPRICDEHYPHHPGGNGPRQPSPRPRTEAEAAFLAIGDGAHRWLVTLAGEKDVLGLWAGSGGEGAEFWMSVLTGLACECLVQVAEDDADKEVLLPWPGAEAAYR